MSSVQGKDSQARDRFAGSACAGESKSQQVTADARKVSVLAQGAAGSRPAARRPTSLITKTMQARFSPQFALSYTLGQTGRWHHGGDDFDATWPLPDDRHMAKTTITQITDDFDGSKDAKTYSFAWQGTEYSIDLSNKNFKALDKLLSPYIEAGEKVTRRASSSRRSSPTASSSRKDFPSIREWAKNQGLEVSDRGRIPREIVEQYEAAH
jgi:hypothetical protein